MKTKTKTKTKTEIRCPVLYRDMPIDRAALDEEKRMIQLSFSSENGVDRWFGKEILDHNPRSVDLSRLRDGGPLLLGHDSDDQIGVIEDARIVDKRGLATVRFSRSARGEEIFQDVRDGIRRNVSVGYRVRKMVLEEEDEDSGNTYRATDWMPMEVSIVSVPADNSVGVGRKEQDREEPIIVTRKAEMDEQELNAQTFVPEPEPETPSPIEVREEAVQAERQRQSEITTIARNSQRWFRENPKKLIELVDKANKDGWQAEQFRKEVLDMINNVRPLILPDPPPASIGLREREVRKYSWCRAIMNVAEHRFHGTYEHELSEECSKKFKREPEGSFWVPPDVLHYRNGEMLQRDLTVGTATAGGNLVATNLLASSFIDLLRNRMVVAGMGATILDGLVGAVAIPRQTSATTAYWTTEQGTTTESNAAFDQVTMTPRGVSAIQDFSKQLLLQATPSIDALVRRDLATVLALAQDLAALHGTGANNQPTGVIQTTGIGDVAGGANGNIPSWNNVVDLETKVATANADIGSLGYITNAKVRGILKVTEKAANTGQFVWTDTGTGGMLNGYRAAVTNQVASNLTKGGSGAVCSAIFFGNWSDLIIGQWGGLDVTVDPYTQAATRTIRIVSSLYTDIAVRHAASFAVMQDAITA